MTPWIVKRLWKMQRKLSSCLHERKLAITGWHRSYLCCVTSMVWSRTSDTTVLPACFRPAPMLVTPPTTAFAIVIAPCSRPSSSFGGLLYRYRCTHIMSQQSIPSRIEHSNICIMQSFVKAHATKQSFSIEYAHSPSFFLVPLGTNQCSLSPATPCHIPSPRSSQCTRIPSQAPCGYRVPLSKHTS